jgi:uncharacterized membrane protein
MSRLHLHRPHFTPTLSVFVALSIAMSSTPVSAQADLHYYPEGTFAFFISADGTTVVGNESAFTSPQVFVQKNGTTGNINVPGGFFPFPAGVSGDGTKVILVSGTANGFETFLWQEGDDDAVPLDLGTSFSFGPVISEDGLTIVGTRATATGLTGYVLQDGVPVSLTFEGRGAFPNSTSANGNIVVGDAVMADGFTERAFYWRPGDAEVTLLPIPDNGFSSSAMMVSADGSTVIGLHGFVGRQLAFVWKVGDPEVSYIDLGTGSMFLGSVSADGSTVVGMREQSQVRRGWVWRNGVVELLELPAGRQYSFATLVSADGSRILGMAWSDFTPTIDGDNMDVVVWDGDAEPRFLKDMLADEGVFVDARRLRELNMMSADGTRIIGRTLQRTQNPGGSFSQVEGSFLATLPLPKTPAEKIQDLIDTVQGFDLQHGIETSLVAKLNASLNALSQGDSTTAIAKLTDFINQVTALRGNLIPVAAADEMIADAEEIIDDLSG